MDSDTRSVDDNNMPDYKYLRKIAIIGHVDAFAIDFNSMYVAVSSQLSQTITVYDETGKHECNLHELKRSKSDDQVTKLKFVDLENVMTNFMANSENKDSSDSDNSNNSNNDNDESKNEEKEKIDQDTTTGDARDADGSDQDRDHGQDSKDLRDNASDDHDDLRDHWCDKSDKYLISSSHNGRIRLWNVTKQCLIEDIFHGDTAVTNFVFTTQKIQNQDIGICINICESDHNIYMTSLFWNGNYNFNSTKYGKNNYKVSNLICKQATEFSSIKDIDISKNGKYIVVIGKDPISMFVVYKVNYDQLFNVAANDTSVKSQVLIEVVNHIVIPNNLYQCKFIGDHTVAWSYGEYHSSNYIYHMQADWDKLDHRFECTKGTIAADKSRNANGIIQIAVNPTTKLLASVGDSCQISLVDCT